MAAALATLALASFGLAACGESSGGGPSQAGAAVKQALQQQIAKAKSVPSTTTAAPRPTTGPTGVRSTSPRISGVRACLEKSGAVAKGASHGPLAGGSALKGAKRARLTAALRKCLGTAHPNATGAALPRTSRTPRFKQALEKYAACLHQNGVPVSKGSAGGPLGLQGVDRSSPAYKSAVMKCHNVLTAALRGGL
jgi:hypothetical protein